MPETNIQTSQRTDCNNGECVQITTTCVDGECSERRLVVNEQQPMMGDRNTNVDDTGDTDDTDDTDDSSSDGSSDNGCEDYKNKTIALIFSGIDVTITSILLSLIMMVLFMVGIFKMKKKK